MLPELGLAGMFVSALLAATLLPLGSEAVLLALLAADYAPLPLVIIATAGNVSGSLINFWLGRYAGRAGVQRVLKVSDATMLSAQRHFQKYGIWSLCFAWLPVVGDPLTFIAGIYGMNFEYMPELGYRYGYFFVWGVMLGIGGMLIWLFKRKHWF